MPSTSDGTAARLSFGQSVLRVGGEHGVEVASWDELADKVVEVLVFQLLDEPADVLLTLRIRRILRWV